MQRTPMRADSEEASIFMRAKLSLQYYIKSWWSGIGLRIFTSTCLPRNLYIDFYICHDKGYHLLLQIIENIKKAEGSTWSWRGFPCKYHLQLHIHIEYLTLDSVCSVMTPLSQSTLQKLPLSFPSDTSPIIWARVEERKWWVSHGSSLFGKLRVFCTMDPLERGKLCLEGSDMKP